MKHVIIPRPFFAFIIFLLSIIEGFAQKTPSARVLLHNADSLFAQTQWAAAKENYIQYLKDTSSNALAWNRLGYSNQNLGLYDEAIKNYQRSLANNPPPGMKAVVEARMSRTFALLSKSDDALSWLDKAIQTGYSNLQELDTLKDFNSVRSNPRFKELYQKVFAAAYPCSTNPKAREFDFWVGEWDVYQTGSNFIVGHSVVQNIAGGCGILENWTAITANDGKSINYYNVGTGKWEQDWVGSGGIAQRYTDGVYRDSAMRFTYEYLQKGTKVIGNFIFYNLGADKVRQYYDMSTDNGKTFQVSYDFTYVRKR